MMDNTNTANTVSVKPEKKVSIKSGGNIFSLMMLIPAIFHFLVLYCGTNIGSILLAFTTTVEGEEVFSLIHFQKFFDELSNVNSGIYMALINTLEYYLLGLVKFVLTSVIAYFFYKKVYGHKIFKVIFFLPSMVPGLVYVSLFREFVFDEGPLEILIQSLFNVELEPLLQQAGTAKITIMFYSFWSGFGTQLLVQIGSMNRIPEDVIEAATLDGCIGFKEFWYIVMPLIFETIATYFLLGIVGIFQSSGPFLFFVGDSMPEVHTLSYWIFLQAYGGATNYPAAIGLFFTVIALPLVLISRWGISKVDTVTY